MYKVQNNNSIQKKEITTGIRSNGMIEVLTGVEEGDKIVAEGLKKVNPKGKIKPILK